MLKAFKTKFPMIYAALDFFFPIILVVILFYGIFAVAYTKGSSMEPTYQNTTFVIGLRHATPDRKDVVLIDSKAAGLILIKRVVGMPGETIEIKEGITYINGEPLNEPYVVNIFPIENMAPRAIPEGYYFVMGDNRPTSADSRSERIGLVPENELIGVVLFSIP